MTLETAGFSDEIQLQDMTDNPQGGQGFIDSDLGEYSSEVNSLFKQSDGPLSVMYANGEVLAVGIDQRQQGDLIATSEVNAIQIAALKQKELQVKEPWNLSSAMLISTTPLSYCTSCPFDRFLGEYWRIPQFARNGAQSDARI